jgi:hypothetical protein
MRVALFNRQGSHLQHEHDATGPIPCFNIFDARSRYPQLTTAMIDGSIDPSNSLIMSNGIAERSDGKLRLARATRYPIDESFASSRCCLSKVNQPHDQIVEFVGHGAALWSQYRVSLPPSMAEGFSQKMNALVKRALTAFRMQYGCTRNSGTL